mmetsp:Transcript_8606/g.24917  ORF Transcript_8606/g.24917 Transcript_8606/m.24917 type:complete len:128 (-) Transcript_8606:68-451(-)
MSADAPYRKVFQSMVNRGDGLGAGAHVWVQGVVVETDAMEGLLAVDDGTTVLTFQVSPAHELQELRSRLKKLKTGTLVAALGKVAALETQGVDVHLHNLFNAGGAAAEVMWILVVANQHLARGDPPR